VPGFVGGVRSGRRFDQGGVGLVLRGSAAGVGTKQQNNSHNLSATNKKNILKNQKQTIPPPPTNLPKPNKPKPIPQNARHLYQENKKHKIKKKTFPKYKKQKPIIYNKKKKTFKTNQKRVEVFFGGWGGGRGLGWLGLGVGWGFGVGGWGSGWFWCTTPFTCGEGLFFFVPRIFFRAYLT